MIVKIHSVKGKKIIAIIDDDLIGKRIEEGRLQLDCAADFYIGEEKSEEEIKRMAQGAYILNIVGEKSIQWCQKQNWIDQKNIIRIGNVPHAEVLMVTE